MSRAMFVVVWMAWIATAAWGQCESGWIPSPPAPELTMSGATSACRALVTYDPDGPGPLGARLLAGGGFDRIDGVAARGVAEWDGTRWTGLFSTQGAMSVECLTIWNGQIIAGGTFNLTAGVQGVARWDGTAWRALGAGVTNSVRAAAVFNGELYIGGAFLDAGGDPNADYLARWDGVQWRSVSSQTIGGPIITTEVRALVAAPDGLAIGGSFYTVGGNPSPGVAVWDGSQWQLRPGFANGDRVNALLLVDGLTYAGGLFAGAPGVAHWDGATWQTISGLTNGGEVMTLATFGSDLYAGGTLSSIGGASTPTRLARRTAGGWAAAADGGMLVHSAGGLRALAEYQGRLVVGGNAFGFQLHSSGTPTIRGTLMTWDGSAWATFGQGLDGGIIDFQPFGPDVIVAGSFRVGSGRRLNGVARFDGATFHPFGQGLLGTFAAASGEIVADLHLADDGTLYAAGQMGAVAGGSASTLGGVAKWDGSAWVRTIPGNLGHPSGQMYDFANFNGQLFVGGNGAAGGNTGVLRLAGTSWAGTGGPLETPLCVEAFGGVLYAGRYRWDGAGAWTFMANTPSMVKLRELDGEFFALANGPFPNGNASVGVLRGGAWTSVGTVRVARHNGIAWRALTNDPDGVAPFELTSSIPRVSAVMSHQGQLWFGGVFANAGGQTSPFFARYSSVPPTITLPPTPVIACPGNDAVFTVAAENAGNAEYRWRRDGALLAEGVALPGGGIPSGVSTPTLTIAGAGVPDSGAIDCIVSTPCGTARSAPAALTIQTCCNPDYTGDGNIDQDDVACLVSLIAGDPSCSAADPDFNRDGNADQSDLAALVNVVAGGACP